MTKRITIPAITILFSFLLLTFSCKKEQQENVFDPVKNISFSIIQAKAWYNNQMNKKTGSETNRSGIDNKITSFITLWNKATTCEDNRYYIVECPLKFDDSPGYLVLPNNGNTNVNGITRLLILKEKITGAIQSALIHIYSESGIVDAENDYSKRKYNFSGTVFFTDLNGSFINGWIYQDGKIIKKSNANTSSTVARVAPPPSDECQVVETRWYIRTCQYYDDGSESCTEWRYTGSTFTTYCPDGSGDGGGGGYTGDNADCTASALNTLTQNSATSNETKSITTIENLSTTRTKKYEWIILKNIGWYIFSFEQGVHIKTVNSNPNLQWKWQSLEHNGISMVGVVIGGSIDYSLISAIPTIGQYNAIMDLTTKVKYSVVCRGSPLATELVYNSNKNFNVND